MQKICMMVIVVVMMVPAMLAENAGPSESTCNRPEFRQFDFWKGDWNLRWSTGKSIPTGTGINHVTTILDGCVVEEDFSFPAGDLEGKSLSTYDTRINKWQQTWVDNHGGYLDFVGEMHDGKMILERETVSENGASLRQRMVWKNIEKDALDRSLELSRDGGKTWEVIWSIHYTRRLRLPGRK